jgi:hypothetical protein
MMKPKLLRLIAITCGWRAAGGPRQPLRLQAALTLRGIY